MHNKHKQPSLSKLPIPTRSSKLPSARRRMVLLPLAMALLLAAYGGGGDGSLPDGNPPLEGNLPPSNNQPPVAVAGCLNTPQDTVLTGFLQATDHDNNSNELTFSLNPNVPNVSGPIWTAKGSIQLLDTTTGRSHTRQAS